MLNEIEKEIAQKFEAVGQDARTSLFCRCYLIDHPAVLHQSLLQIEDELRGYADKVFALRSQLEQRDEQGRRFATILKFLQASRT